MAYTDKEKAKDAAKVGKELTKLAMKNKQAQTIIDLQKDNIKLKNLVGNRKNRKIAKAESYPGLKRLGSKPSTPA